jgi:hypothetical protein
VSEQQRRPGWMDWWMGAYPFWANLVFLELCLLAASG